MPAATQGAATRQQGAGGRRRMAPDQGVAAARPAAGWRPARIIASGNSVGATAQWRGSERSLGTLRAAVTTSAEPGSDRYFSLSGAWTFLRSVRYGIRTFS